MANVNITIALQGMQSVTAGLATVNKQLGALQRQAAPGVTGLGTQFRAMGVQAGFAAQGLAAAQTRMATLQRTATTGGAAIARIQAGFSSLQAGASRVSAALSTMGSGFARFQQRALVSAAFFGLIGFAVKGLITSLAGASDAWVSMSARMQVVSKSSADNARQMETVFKIAQDARVPLEAVGKTYTRIALATERLGITQSQVASMTSTLSKALTLSGATAEEAANGMIQLTQAMSKGKLDGDELRSVFENMPLVVKAMEEATGKSRGELYKLASQGKITAQVLGGSLLLAEDKVAEAFAKMPRTFGQASTQLSNAWIKMIGTVTTSGGQIRELNKTIDELVKLISSPAFAAGMAAFLSFMAKGATYVGQFVRSFAPANTTIEGSRALIAGMTRDLAAQKIVTDEAIAVGRQRIKGIGDNNEAIEASRAEEKRLTEGIKTQTEILKENMMAANLRAVSRPANNKLLTGPILDTSIADAQAKEAEARARNLQIMNLQNSSIQANIDGNYDEVQSLNAKIRVLQDTAHGQDAATSSAITLNEQLQQAAQVAQATQTPYEKYKQTLAALQQEHVKTALSAQQMAAAHVMAAATAVEPWMQVASTIGQAMSTMFGESQGVQIAVAIINTLAGITQALASYPPPVSYAMAAATAALGFAQVAKIKSTKPGSGTASAGKAKGKGKKKLASGGVVPGMGGGDIIPAMLTPGEFVINKNSSARHRGLLQQINSNRMAAGGVVGGGKSTWGGAGDGGTTIIFSGITAVDEIGISRLERRLTKRTNTAQYRRYGVTS